MNCSKCKINVHKNCYGIKLDHSEDIWYFSYALIIINFKKIYYRNCNPCEEKILNPYCAVCPLKGGAFKRTTTGQWIHVLDAILMPEILFKKDDSFDNIDISGLWSDRKSLICKICNKRGGCVQCNTGKCAYSIHPICAVFDKESRVYVGIDLNSCEESKKNIIVYSTFCPNHHKQAEKSGNLPGT